jgi:hypothetical protein
MVKKPQRDKTKRNDTIKQPNKKLTKQDKKNTNQQNLRRRQRIKIVFFVNLKRKN